MVLTTGETATTWVLAVLADTTVTGRDVAAVLAGLGKVSRHLLVVNVVKVGEDGRWVEDASAYAKSKMVRKRCRMVERCKV